jgi:LmbE family N-acetylglucosaminyl deacetylase
MLSVLDLTRVKRVLCLGAHCDDIEIGAGGTIMHLARSHPDLEVKWVIFAGESPVRVEEARRSAEVFLAGTSTKSEIVIHGFRDGFLPFQGELLKETFEDLKASFAPDLILTHHDDDRHQDHRLVSQLTWNTWRDHMILEYEIMKYDGDLGRPNLFVPLSRDLCHDKIGSLLEVFPIASRDNGSTRRRFGRCCGCAASNATRRRGLPKRSSCARCLLSPRAFGEHPKHPRLASFRRRP